MFGICPNCHDPIADPDKPVGRLANKYPNLCHCCATNYKYLRSKPRHYPPIRGVFRTREARLLAECKRHHKNEPCTHSDIHRCRNTKASTDKTVCDCWCHYPLDINDFVQVIDQRSTHAGRIGQVQAIHWTNKRLAGKPPHWIITLRFKRRGTMQLYPWVRKDDRNFTAEQLEKLTD